MFDINELKKQKIKNFEELWREYIKSISNKVWSIQQAELIVK